ncbi:hypothetical protein EU546_08570 [Candidatus Thorarchaeota archaeon]|nr:MAG: hypothetical protein EU546_08570 [Candidatus Thorarchaeota archaeon]
MSDRNSQDQLVALFSKQTEEHLRARFEDERAEVLHRLYDRQFKIHYNNYEHLMPDDLSKRHGINSIHVMAMDDILMEERASFSQLKEAVIEIDKSMLEDYFVEELQMIEGMKDSWKGFVSWVMSGNKSNYMNDYFKLEELESTGSCVGFNLHRCLYFDILHEAGRSELTPILCEYDGMLGGMVAEWIDFRRKRTIAKGDSECTFRYHKK